MAKPNPFINSLLPEGLQVLYDAGTLGHKTGELFYSKK